MFNIGPGELMAIAAVALIVLGPQRLPQALRSVGRVLGELRRISGGFQDELRRAIEESDIEPEGELVGDITEGRPVGPAASPPGTADTVRPGGNDAAKPSATADDDEPDRMLLPSDTPDADDDLDPDADRDQVDAGSADDDDIEADAHLATDDRVDRTDETDGRDDAANAAGTARGTEAAGGERAVS